MGIWYGGETLSIAVGGVAMEALRIAWIVKGDRKTGHLSNREIESGSRSLQDRLRGRPQHGYFSADDPSITANRLRGLCLRHGCAGRPARSRWCKSTTMKE